LAEIAEPELYNFPQFSPDLTKIAAIKFNLQEESNDIVVIDTRTGEETRITVSASREGVGTPVWSPDSSELAYVALRDSYFGIYRIAADGRGDPELIYRHGGANIVLADWSLDGRYLSFSASDLTGGTLYTLDLEGDGEPVIVARSDSMMTGPRFSPDGKFLSYVSNKTGRIEYYVTPSVPAPDGEETQVWQVTDEGGFGIGSWDADDPVFVYLGNERQVMAIDVDTSDGFDYGSPYPVFTVPDRVPAGGGGPLVTMSRYGEQFIFALPPRPDLMQIAVLDRAGNVVSRIGEPNRYAQPSFSPDGSKILAMRIDDRTGTVDLWTFDVATGEATQVTDTVDFDEAGPIWLPDGEHVAYSYFDEDHSWIYRKRADGRGEQELLFRYTPGAFITLMDASDDGAYLAFESFGFVVTAPLTGNDPLAREGIDLLREEYEVSAPRFSPDGKHVAYTYNETGREEVYVTVFDSATGMAGNGERVQVSTAGTLGAIAWRGDGAELLFVSENTEAEALETLNVRVMAAAITTEPMLEAEPPRVLFELSLPPTGNSSQWQNVSADGEHFLFVMPAE
ncbi:MAG TPA: hypothetical protein VKQ06_09955, partial [Gammaproteobacteria bacterium]|nr:hypothetical protein [Gammaproteobacteria bacterium]